MRQPLTDPAVDVSVDGDLFAVRHFPWSQVNNARSTAGRVFADLNIAALAGPSR
jgi:hypothetical protein